MVKVTNLGYRRRLRHLLEGLWSLSHRRRSKRRRLLVAEVGVARGECSAYLLHHCPMISLVMVDPWKEWPLNSRYVKSQDKMALRGQQEWSAMRAEAEEVAARWPGRAGIVPLTSRDAAGMFRTLGTRFDLVYVDADHSYEGVREDLNQWAGLVRPGGILCGDEWERRWYPGATQAVREFAAARRWQLHEGPCHIWHFEVPDPAAVAAAVGAWE